MLREPLLLIAEMLLYFGAMLGLFRARQRLGLGAFYCALGSLHFLEPISPPIFYVQVLPDWTLTPGSVVLFSGKLLLLLMVYVREDAAVVRQPIYGLLLGNLLVIAMVAVLRGHEPLAKPDGSAPDLGLLGEMGGLMLWGTLLLFLDSLMIILLYERLARWQKAMWCCASGWPRAAYSPSTRSASSPPCI